MTIGLLLTALGLGLRHGIDWDHIAAIADLSSSADSRRRGFMLSFLYALGHAVVVVALGSLAILFGAALPDAVDVWMGRVVGLTLVALGAWVLIELLRKGKEFRLRSRWILVLSGTFAGLRRVREANARRRLTIAHEHQHEHEVPPAMSGSPDDGPGANDHDLPFAHDHAHIADGDPIAEPARPVAARQGTAPSDRHRQVGGGGGRNGDGPGLAHRLGWAHSHGHGNSHSHRHSHETTLARSAEVNGNGTAAGIGVLHGVGIESPTQIAVFVASTSVVGAWAGLSLLLAWVIGLLIANSMLAGLAAFGLLGAERNFVIYATVAAFVGVASLTVGILMLVGFDTLLPAL